VNTHSSPSIASAISTHLGMPIWPYESRAPETIAMAIRRLVAQGSQDRSNIEVGLVFGGRSLLPLAQGVRGPGERPGEEAEGDGEGERPPEEACGGPLPGQLHTAGGLPGKLLSPAKRRLAVEHVRDALGRGAVSERRACGVLGQVRSTQRRGHSPPADEPGLVRRMVELATEYGRYGYRRVAALLREEGWRVNHKRVERLWRQEGLRVPAKQPRRGRLWLTDGSCIRLRPAFKNHVWSYDFMVVRTREGRPLRLLTIIDEYSRECLAIEVARRITSDDVLGRLTQLFVERFPPHYLRSDNGAEFTATVVREWLERVGVKTLYIEPASPWENGYIESFNGKLRDELLNLEVFDTVLEARVLCERWRRHYNAVRPHSSLGYRPPAPETVLSWPSGVWSHQEVRIGVT
jgi:putative transposase